MNEKRCSSTQEKILEVDENPDNSHSPDKTLLVQEKQTKQGLILHVSISWLLSVKTTLISQVLSEATSLPVNQWSSQRRESSCTGELQEKASAEDFADQVSARKPHVLWRIRIQNCRISCLELLLIRSYALAIVTLFWRERNPLVGKEVRVNNKIYL